MWRESVNPRTKRVPARKSRGNGSLLLDFLPAPCLHPSSPLVALPPTLPQPIYLAFITLKARNAHLESSIDKLSVRYIYIYTYVCTYFPIVKFVFYFLLTFSFFFFLTPFTNTENLILSFLEEFEERVAYSFRWRVMEERSREIVFKVVGK